MIGTLRPNVPLGPPPPSCCIFSPLGFCFICLPTCCPFEVSLSLTDSPFLHFPRRRKLFGRSLCFTLVREFETTVPPRLCCCFGSRRVLLPLPPMFHVIGWPLSMCPPSPPLERRSVRSIFTFFCAHPVDRTIICEFFRPPQNFSPLICCFRELSRFLMAPPMGVF